MLQDDLYTIKEITTENNTIEASIALNETHEIFKGHFPGQPVLPGVCMLQMVKEILETSINIKLQLLKADEIKFLSMIQPSNEVLQFLIQYKFIQNSVINISAKIIMKEIICCKMKASFRIKN